MEQLIAIWNSLNIDMKIFIGIFIVSAYFGFGGKK